MHVKDPSHCAKSAGGRLHLNTHTTLTRRGRKGLTTPLSRHSLRPIRKRVHTQLSGNIRPQSSQLGQPLWTDPGIKIGMSVSELISTEKKKKKRRQGINGRQFYKKQQKKYSQANQYSKCPSVCLSEKIFPLPSSNKATCIYSS